MNYLVPKRFASAPNWRRLVSEIARIQRTPPQRPQLVADRRDGFILLRHRHEDFIHIEFRKVL